MALSNTEQPARSTNEAAHEPTSIKPAVPTTMNPELPMAARLGDSKKLKNLLDEQHQAPLRPVAQQPPPPSAASTTAPQEVVVEVDRRRAAAPSAAVNALLAGVTSEGDSVLHVVAACGENKDFLDCADTIYGAASHRLHARNSAGDTPLHHAAMAGSVAMVRHLIDKAKARSDGNDDQRSTRVALAVELLRAQNKQGGACRSTSSSLWMRGWLVSQTMAPRRSTWPSLCDTKKLHEKDEQLSYSGPEGRNALHVSVLAGKGPTQMILQWKEGLAKQGDQNGRTPLHFAASMNRPLIQETLDTITLLLKEDQSCAYKPDNKGFYPIHVAAELGGIVGFFTVRLMIKLCPDSASLRDSMGWTFLHVAINNRCKSVVALADLARVSPGA
uniref:Uncharacterized protein n=1 Tax=Leersia perrieri TaxID=77586 RepID=A0A0D9XCL7_9ORYZ